MTSQQVNMYEVDKTGRQIKQNTKQVTYRWYGAG